jgi:hypothetical protein
MFGEIEEHYVQNRSGRFSTRTVHVLALRACLRLFKIIPNDFVDPGAGSIQHHNRQIKKPPVDLVW